MSEFQECVFDYTKRQRFAVVRKLPRNQRYGSNFLRLYEDRADAEQEALRLAQKLGEKFYIIEIQRIATPGAVQEASAEAVNA